MKNIKGLSEKYYEKLKDIRHRIHMYPEDGFCEFKTSKLIIEELTNLGIKASPIAKTGVLGIIEGKYEGKTVLLRADMDALQVEEKADVEYKSKIKGMMHACGHDGHVTGVLGAAMILNELKDELHGNVKFAFQPAEEREGGAQLMIKEGILENPKVDIAFGAHVWGEMKEGMVGVKKGALMAAPDIFNFKITGVGGHAAVPHISIDPITITCQIINGIQTIVSRMSNPVDPVVISCCKIQGGETHNVIPNDVEVEGTIRTLNEETRKWVPNVMENVIKGITSSYGATYEFEYDKGYPVLINDDKATSMVSESIAKIIGNENIIEMKEPSMGGEDFAYFAQNVPASFYFVGIAKDENKPVIHHNPYFEWDDNNLKILSETLAQATVDFLSDK